MMHPITSVIYQLCDVGWTGVDAHRSSAAESLLRRSSEALSSRALKHGLRQPRSFSWTISRRFHNQLRTSLRVEFRQDFKVVLSQPRRVMANPEVAACEIDRTPD